MLLDTAGSRDSSPMTLTQDHSLAYITSTARPHSPAALPALGRPAVYDTLAKARRWTRTKRDMIPNAWARRTGICESCMNGGLGSRKPV